MATAGDAPPCQINNEVKFYVLWEQQRLGRQLLLDHPAHHHYLLLRLGRQRRRHQLRMWLWVQQRLRLLLKTYIARPEKRG